MVNYLTHDPIISSLWWFSGSKIFRTKTQDWVLRLHL